MEKYTIRIIGFFLLIGGLGLSLNFGGNQGFSAGLLSGLAYISGFIIAFVGAYLAFIYGRSTKSEEEEV